MSQNNQVAKIKYVKFLNAKRNYKSVSHEKLNSWTVKNFNTNGMFESLLNLEYVRLYFDFDFHEGEEIIPKIKEIFELLDNFRNVFGEYVFAGYCCDEELYNQLDQEVKEHIELKTIKFEKPLSFHVVFYETRILQEDLLTERTTALRASFEVQKRSTDVDFVVCVCIFDSVIDQKIK